MDPAARETLWDVTIVKKARLWRETAKIPDGDSAAQEAASETSQEVI